MLMGLVAAIASLIVAIPALATMPVTMEAEGWRYDDTGVDPGATWMDPSYDDSTWSEGQAELGFGDGDENTVVANHGGYAYYFRTTFEIDDLAEVAAAFLTVTYDDGVVVYLNGSEVDRFNMPGGAITHTTAALASINNQDTEEGIAVDLADLVVGDNVLSVGIHQANVASGDISMDAELCLDTDRGPYLLDVTATGATVMWGSCTEGDSTVEYGPTAAYGYTEYDATSTSIHSIGLAGLAADTDYHYRVSTGAVTGVDHVFTTAPATGADFTFAFYGDSRGGTVVHGAIADRIAGEAPDLVLHGGDLVNQAPSHTTWGVEFFDPAAVYLPDQPLLMTPGNHESPFDYAYTWFDDYFPPQVGGETYFSAVWGDARFVVLDTNDPEFTGEVVGVLPVDTDQYLWLEAELAGATEPLLFVLHHHPVYSSGHHAMDHDVVAIQDNLAPLYRTYGVDAVFCSHEHAYERSFDGEVHYLTVGGGGAPLQPNPGNSNPYQAFQADSTCYTVVDVIGGEAWASTYDDSGALLEPAVLLTDDAPLISLDARPDCDIADEWLTVTWSDDDPDSDAQIEFWLDDDAIDCGGVALGSAISEDDPADTEDLDVSAVPDGLYYLCAVISDDAHEVEAYASGSVRISHALIGAGVELLPMGSTWSYYDDGGPPPGPWFSPAYDDSSWSEGCGELGYGDGDERTEVEYGPNPDYKFPTTYFRAEFELTAPLPARIALEMIVDDGAQVRLNGRPVRRFNLTPPVHYNTLAATHRENDAPTVLMLPIWASNFLVEGTNVLAIEVHQAALDSSDLSFDARVVGLY